MSNWMNGIIGAIVGDALGVPYEFKKRGTFKCTGMSEYGSHHMPKGTWSDDSSMIIATIDSICKEKRINSADIMIKFQNWLNNAEYCAVNKVFDCGITVQQALRTGEALRDEHSNGNGALMRIIPVCLYCVEHHYTPHRSIKFIHEVSGLTHGHVRSKIGCGLYYSYIFSLITHEGTLKDKIKWGSEVGFTLYKDRDEAKHYDRLRDIDSFSKVAEDDIKSSGYVVDSLEAAIWCLLNTNSYKECVIKAVELGGDTDTIACIAGGLAGIYYGIENIPEEWINCLQKKEWLLEMINEAENC